LGKNTFTIGKYLAIGYRGNRSGFQVRISLLSFFSPEPVDLRIRRKVEPLYEAINQFYSFVSRERELPARFSWIWMSSC
jgi:hypothetical protein